MTEEKRRCGRRTTYKPEYCEKLIECGQRGEGVSEFCASVGTSRQVFHQWLKANDDLRDAYELHGTHLQAWWERAGREGMTSPNFNASVWCKNMHNRFPQEWRDKVDLNHSGGVTLERITRRVIDPKAA